jgi:hypothetical protein
MTEQEIVNLVQNMKEKGWSFSKTIVTLTFFLAITYTVTILIIFYLTGNEPVVLTPTVFGFLGGEMLVLGAVRIFKPKKK